MANKNRKFVFLRRKCNLMYPLQLGVLGRTSIEPITPGLSQRGRLLGAVAQWQLRLCFFLSLECDEIFVQLNEYLGNCPKLCKGSPFHFFYFLNITQNRTRLKVPFQFFRHCPTFEIFSSPKVPPLILLKSPLVLSRSKELYPNF